MSVDIKGGYYFCFEGIPGSGKSTQKAKLIDHLMKIYPN